MTGAVVPTTDQNRRGEIKITGTPASNHTIQGGYLNDPRKRTNNSGLQSLVIDPRSEVNRENPNWYAYGNYRGVLRNNVLAEFQYSERRFQFLKDGGTSLDITDSPFVGTCYCTVYNAPYFDATDPESRNNKQFTGNLTNYWNRGGRHETKYGYEFFRSQRTGGNSQSSTWYVFGADFVTNADGTPAIDGQGRLIPIFVPGVTYGLLPRDQRGHDEHGQPLLVRAGSLDDQQPVVGRSRRAIRAGERHLEPRRHQKRRRPPDRAASGAGLRRKRQRQSDLARHLRAVYRPVQRGAHRRQQPGRQPGGCHAHLSGSGRPGRRLRSGNERGQLPDHFDQRDGVRSGAERLHRGRHEVAAGPRVLDLVRSGVLERPRPRRGQLHLPEDGEPD